MIIQLTDFDFKTFYLNSAIIEDLRPNNRGGSEIRLTSGRFVSCVEPPEEVMKIVLEALGGRL